MIINQVELAPNVENIASVVENFCSRKKNKERLYVHFSGCYQICNTNHCIQHLGHGVNNAKLEVDKIVKDPRTNKDVIHTNTPDGDCLVGTGGHLFSVHDLKHTLLDTKPDRVVLTLDMCRNIDKRGPNKYSIKLRYTNGSA